MKKHLLTIIGLMLALSVVLSFAGCGENKKDDKESTKAPASSQNGTSSNSNSNGENSSTDNSSSNTANSNESLDSALEDYMNVVLSKTSYKTLAPNELWDKIIELIMEEEGLSKTDAETYLDASMNEEFSYSYSDMVDEYGENLKLSYNITTTKKYRGDEYDEILDYISDGTGLKKELIGEIGEFECELGVEGNNGSDTVESSMGYFVYDGKYYLGVIIESFF